MKNNLLKIVFVALMVITISLSGCAEQTDTADTGSTSITGLTYPIVDTNQGTCYDNSERIECPAEGDAFYGQDAQYTGITPSYTDNGDGTVTDDVTGLVWAQDLSDSSMSWEDANEYCESLELGGYDDWRLPTVKELWSLRDYSQGWPWIDTNYFYLVGDGSDLAQHHSWTSNLYLVESEYQNEQVQGDPAFIVNDWTGHIKAMSGNRFVRAVRGDTSYGINDFVDNGDGTVTDEATGLMWSQEDSGEAMSWEDALAYAEDSTYAGYDDWRLPNIKELQSIADYSGSFPAIDTSVFDLTEITNVVYDSETGDVIAEQVDYPFYWSSTSNPIEGDGDDIDGGTVFAWFLASGYNADPDGYDLHGAGSICFDRKSVDVSDDSGNYVRLVRGGDVVETPDGDPSVIDTDRVVVFEDGDTGMSNRGSGPDDRSAPDDEQSGGPGEQQEMPDLTAAAAELGITEDELVAALGEPGQTPPDFAAAAAELGVTEEVLMEALGTSAGGPPAGQS